jgi:hypothetical protein
LRPVAAVILILIVASVCAAPASAADVTITFDKQQVQAKMILSVHQNMTRFPNQATSLDASSGANVSSAINEALRGPDRSASFSALSVKVKSNATWLNLSVVMSLAGVSERRGDVADVNMTWKAFNTTADLRVGNFSYNTVGSRYFRPVVDFYQNASKFENSPNATIKAVTFFVNGTSVAGASVANQVGNFTVLDFRSLDLPLDQWNRTYNLANNTTTWRYAPPTILNASIRVQELNKTFTLFSYYAYGALITVQGLASAHGNLLRADVGTGQQEWIMTGAVLLAVVAAVVVQVSFRRKRKALRLGRR